MATAPSINSPAWVFIPLQMLINSFFAYSIIVGKFSVIPDNSFIKTSKPVSKMFAASSPVRTSPIVFTSSGNFSTSLSAILSSAFTIPVNIITAPSRSSDVNSGNRSIMPDTRSLAPLTSFGMILFLPSRIALISRSAAPRMNELKIFSVPGSLCDNSEIVRDNAPDINFPISLNAPITSPF